MKTTWVRSTGWWISSARNTMKRNGKSCGDLIPEKETRHIADTIPGAELQILKGEDHGSYIVHSTKIAGLIRDFARGTREG